MPACMYLARSGENNGQFFVISSKSPRFLLAAILSGISHRAEIVDEARGVRGDPGERTTSILCSRFRIVVYLFEV